MKLAPQSLKRGSFLTALLLSLTSLPLLAGCGGGGGGGSTLKSRIYFSSDKTGNYEIYYINPDGTGEVKFTSQASFNSYAPEVSTDGKMVAFHRDQPGVSIRNNIWVKSTSGTAAQKLTDADSEPGLFGHQLPSWSPTGNKLVYSNNLRVFTMNADGSGAAQLVTDALGGKATFSPDGTKIIYPRLWVPDPSKPDVTQVDLFVRNVATGVESQVTNDAKGEMGPRWSPADNKICYSANDEIYILTLSTPNGTTALSDQRLTNTILKESSPSWSPDDTKLVFCREDNIYIMGADGSNVTQLTTATTSKQVSPVWSREVYP